MITTNEYFNSEESIAAALPQDHELLPHHTNIERVERRIFEIHVHWRHNATLIVLGFFSFVIANVSLALWFAVSFQKAETPTHYFICLAALVWIVFVFLAAQSLQVATDSLKKSDKHINSLEEEVQRITSNTGYTLNKEVMPLDFYLRNLSLMRAMLYLLLPLWVALPALLLYFSKVETPTHPTKQALSKSMEQQKRGKN
ncbi:hypothetical protein [Armatimonas sp.]|uniref:hypothetical protein n=1 Tax=Armatimonas sp. TaxID=1872638 RepID=UPI00286CF679|nr:hypothetical protein [Armatimonas sp.]